MAGGNNDLNKVAKGSIISSFVGLPAYLLGKDLFKQPKTPTMTPPPATTPAPSPNDQNPVLTAQQRAKKLQALQMGLATTMSNNSTFGNAQTAMPGLKAKLGN